MTCNFVNHERELLDAFDTVCRTPNNWVIFDYEANSNIIKPGNSGNGGLEELVEAFQSSRVEYGFVSVASSDGKQQKVVLIHWQGEAVPAIRLANTASHIEEIRRFVKRVNCTVYARNEEDLDLSTIRQKIQQLATMSQQTKQKSTPFIPPTPVGSVYKPVKEELELSEREQFWKNLQTEEEERRKEEAKRREDQQKQFQLERKILEKELHEMHLSAAVRKAQQDAAKQPPPKPNPKPSPAAAKTLVGSRAKMFNEKVEEIARSTVKTPNKPKQFKFEVAVQPRNPPAPVNAGQFTGADDDFIPVVEDPSSRPVAKIQPQAVEPKQASVEERQESFEGKPESVDEKRDIHAEKLGQNELRAITLWDYQADDSSEISFDSNQLISEIEKVSDGWWRGKLGSQSGLFPANYVKLL